MKYADDDEDITLPKRTNVEATKPKIVKTNPFADLQRKINLIKWKMRQM